jgi:myo-inositol-1(or 4)-monophosphatase
MNEADQKLIHEAKELAEKLAREAGALLVQKKGHGKVVSYKDLQDIQTDIDLEIEKGSEYCWVIDPLDGTKEFIRDIPLYCSAIMLQKNGVPLVASVYDPELDELYSAGLGVGAYLNGNRLHVSEQSDLKKAMLFTYLPRTAKDMMKLAPLFDIGYRIRGHANHNMSYCWVAKGGYEGHFSFFTPQHWWDIAAGILILREAGGKVTNLQNEDITHENYTVDAIGTNGLIHEELLREARKVMA